VFILLFTSLGVGFFISLISETDTQAVQYSMLLLLASIFFSGFFLDLRLMREPVTVLAWSLPATYGIRMLQDVMLRGAAIAPILFRGIALIGLGFFVVDWLLLRRKMES
ncbi:MAG: ABC transporter permease, partial [Anaerolineales bacterium]